MIFDYIIGIIYNIIAFIVNLIAVLDDVTLPADIENSLNSVSGYINGITTIFPILTLLDILFFELLFIGAYFFYKLVRWTYQKIPFIN